MAHQELMNFLCKAKKGCYGGAGSKVTSSRPKSNDFIYKEEELKYIDTNLGNEQFVGEEALWEENQPLWGMNYTGRVLSENFDPEFLRQALSKVTADSPYRGPKLFVKGDYTYKSRTEGDFGWFVGCEKILYKDEKVYEGMYQGGLVK